MNSDEAKKQDEGNPFKVANDGIDIAKMAIGAGAAIGGFLIAAVKVAPKVIGEELPGFLNDLSKKL